MSKLTPEEREIVEELMGVCLVKMRDQDLEHCRQLCMRHLQAVESEIARRKEQRNEQEGGFAA